MTTYLQIAIPTAAFIVLAIAAAAYLYLGDAIQESRDRRAIREREGAVAAFDAAVTAAVDGAEAGLRSER